LIINAQERKIEMRVLGYLPGRQSLPIWQDHLHAPAAGNDMQVGYDPTSASPDDSSAYAAPAILNNYQATPDALHRFSQRLGERLIEVHR
jgi:hypothetical protein